MVKLSAAIATVIEDESFTGVRPGRAEHARDQRAPPPDGKGEVGYLRLPDLIRGRSPYAKGSDPPRPLGRAGPLRTAHPVSLGILSDGEPQRSRLLHGDHNKTSCSERFT